MVCIYIYACMLLYMFGLNIIKKTREKSLIEMALAVPKAFILKSLLDSKLSDSLFKINSFIIDAFLSMSKMPKNAENTA